MEHSNNIEIKLLANRRFIYSNRRQNIIITAEHNATEITVLFPEEYEDYSKRVDFVNSKGKEWTEALYIPEYKSYSAEFDKSRFRFTLPTEVTTEGELKMQFLAYLPDESMATVPFEVVPIDIIGGVLAFKKNARSNPDLLILIYNQSAKALFNSQRAVAKSEQAVEIANQADEQSKEAVETANQTAVGLSEEITAREQADAVLQTAIEAEIQRAKNAESGLASAIADEAQARIAGDEVNAQAIAAEAERATQVEANITVALENETAERIAGDDGNAATITAETARAQSAESDLAASLAAETARAQDMEQTNAQAIAEETERAVTAESGITANLTVEIQRAESDLTAALNSETASRIQGDADNAAAIQAETARSQAVESAVASDLADEMERAQAAEQLNATAIQGEATRAQTAESNLQAAIAAEQARATNAENNLQSAITAETVRTTGAEAGLRADLNSEIARAQTVENELSSDLVTEVTRAKAAEQINANAITTETTRATTAENSLSECITAEESRAKTAEQSNTTAITAEAQRALTAESGLAASILAEETRAEAAEQANSTAITAEQTRAILAEQTLAQSIIDKVKEAQSDWSDNDAESTAYIKNKPTAMPASDVQPWAKALSKPSYIPSEIGAEPVFNKNAAFNKNYGTAAGTVCEGNDSRLSNARTPTAHTHGNGDLTGIAAWAKAASKPTYTASEIGAEPAFTKNAAFNKSFGTASGTVCEGDDTRLSNARTPTTHTHTKSQITDFPTSMPASDVSSWAKAASKPSYTSNEVGAEPAFSKNTAFNKNFGTASGTVCEGNDGRLSDSRTPTAHTHGNNDLTGIAAWAKEASKPIYTASEVGAESSFSKNTAFNKNFGTVGGTVCEGNDSRLSNARTPTSHASAATAYGQGDASNYGHVKLSSLAESTTLPTGDTALKYNYSTAAADINLNTYVYEGRFTLYNVPTTITDSANNFPTGWNTGSQNNNTAYLEVRRFYSNTAIHQTLYKRATVQRWVRVATSSSSWSAWVEVDASFVPNTRTINGKALSANITLAGGDISITPNSNLGNATTLQAALNYIANVFAGTQKVTKIRAGTLDVDA